MNDTRTKDLPDNVLLVGGKDFSSYMRTIEFFIRKQKKKKIIIKARGNNIKKAIDLAEASKNKFLNDLDILIKDVKIYTSKFNDKENIERSVSCIDIEIFLK